jgi:hypothetical protein
MDPPSVELLRAIGVLQELNDGEPIPAEELDTITAESGIQTFDLWPLIEAGVTAGYIDVDEDEAITLTAKGWAWWKRRYADR